MVSPQCCGYPGKGAAQGTPIPQQRWGVLTARCRGSPSLWVMSFPAGDMATNSHAHMGHVVVLLLSSPATPSRLHSCNLNQGLQILPTPAQPPPGGLSPSSWHSSLAELSQGQKGVWNQGKGQGEV